MSNQFSDAPWSNPVSKLSAADYAKVCMIDENDPGEPKVKDKCKLPYRMKPGGPIYKKALASIASVLAGGMGGVQASGASKMAAARKTLRLMTEAGMTPGDALKKLAATSEPP
jgi:hypothetical protein